jgi:hypothetical protein
VRFNALVAWAARNDGLPSSEILTALLADSEVSVRLQLLAMAAEADDGDSVLQVMAENDPDAYVRAKAKQRRQANASNSAGS